MKSLTLNGLRLAYEDRGAGTPLLLVHGFPLDHTMWARQLDGLASHCRVIAPDLRGFGQSRRTAGAAGRPNFLPEGERMQEAFDDKVTMEQFADDLAALLDGLDVREPIVFCGLSMGGYVALQFWRKYAARLRGLVLCDTRATADSPEVVAGRLATADRVLVEGTAAVVERMLPNLFEKATLTERPEMVEAVRQSALAIDPRGVAAASRGMAERPDMTGRLAEIRCPTLVIVGRSDAVTPPAGMRALAEAIPNARFVEVGGGHMAPLEDPEAVNAAILDFLARA